MELRALARIGVEVALLINPGRHHRMASILCQVACVHAQHLAAALQESKKARRNVIKLSVYSFLQEYAHFQDMAASLLYLRGELLRARVERKERHDFACV